jgi:hypothetical protein
MNQQYSRTIKNENGLNALHSDAHYRSEAGYAMTILPNAPTINLISSTDNFVDQVINSKMPAFEIERTLNQTYCTNHSLISERFYQLMGQYQTCTIPKNILPENVKLFEEVLQQSGYYAIGLTGNPLTVISPTGMIEGEFVNSIIEQVRQGAKRKAIKTQKSARSRYSSNQFAKAKRMIDRCAESFNNNIYVIRMDLDYGNNNIGVHKANEHIKAFTGGLDEQFNHNVFGYLWDRSYWEATGYRHHFFLLLNAQDIDTSGIQASWHRITSGEGCSFEYHASTQHPKSWGCGWLGQSYLHILDAVKAWIKRTDLLMLQPERDIEHCGVSKLPAPAKNFVSSVGWTSASLSPFLQSYP